MILRPNPDNMVAVFDLTDKTRENEPLRLIAGDDLEIVLRLTRKDGQPAKPDNSQLRVTITDGALGSVVYQTNWDPVAISQLDEMGLYKLSVPEQVTELWPEGVYHGGVKIADFDDTRDLTLYTFFLAVSYRPTSPARSLPYD